MSTVAERIAEIKARAAARGIDVDKKQRVSTSRPPRPADPPQPPRELSKREQATLRPLPQSRERCRINTGKDYHHRQRAMDLETKLAAGLVAVALGPEWRREDAEAGRQQQLIHTTGFQISFRRSWRDDGRYEIDPQDAREKTGDDPPDITVSGARTPAAIAGDIRHRIIDRGFLEGCQKVKESRQQRRKRDVDDRLAVLKLIHILGFRQLADERSWKYRGYPESNQIPLAGSTRVKITLDGGYRGRYGISIDTDSDQHAEAIARFLKELE